MNDFSDEDIENMDGDELSRYLSDIKSGYAFDPDNEILEKDKNTPPTEFFKGLNETIDELPFKSMNEYAKAISRYQRLLEWLRDEIEHVDVRFMREYNRRLRECL